MRKVIVVGQSARSLRLTCRSHYATLHIRVKQGNLWTVCYVCTATQGRSFMNDVIPLSRRT
jgi:hypothetical protein